MATFNENWLKKQGLQAPSQTLHQLSDTLEAVLEMRVGYAVASHLTDTQIDEFEKILQETDEDDTDKLRINWLEKNYPKYKHVVRYQKAKLSMQVRNAKNKMTYIQQLGQSEVTS